jgi:hypothetical protein
MEVPSDFPAKTVAEFITYVKRNPGKINFASAGQEPFDEHRIDIAREPREGCSWFDSPRYALELARHTATTPASPQRGGRGAC